MTSNNVLFPSAEERQRFGLRSPLCAQRAARSAPPFSNPLLMTDETRILMSLATAERQWAYAHTWLFAELEEDEKASARENS